MIPERLKKRLGKDRPRTSITLRIPLDVVESLKEIAPRKGFSGYQPLLKAYIGEGLRRDEAEYLYGHTARLIEALKKRGVPEGLIEEAERGAGQGNPVGANPASLPDNERTAARHCPLSRFNPNPNPSNKP